jgi:single-stranded nucleic acid binding R3H domain protein
VKKELIVTGKTVEEARKKAAAQLGVAEEEMIVTVLEEGKKGFLGIGASDAKISVSYSEDGEDTALDFIRKLIDDMALEGLTVAKKEGSNGDVLITVDGDNAGVLIGHHGETLEAIQYLANLAANKKVAGEKREYVRVTVDVEGYRAKREASLRALARRMSAKVIKNKKSVMLEPMNPYERRIVHSEVQGIAGVSTNSIGSENNRRVVIFLDDAQTATGNDEEVDD